MAVKSDLLEYVEIVSELERRQSSTRLYQYYPDEDCGGFPARSRYARHLEFFRAGRDFRERAVIAANRVGKCLGFETLIDLPCGAKRKIGELYESGIKFVVLAWDEHCEELVSAMAKIPFKKPPEMVYRVWLSSGQWFDIAGEHRFLTESGWFFFSHLQQYVACLPPSSSEFGLLRSLEDVMHYLERVSSSPSDYRDSLHLYGEQPLFSLNIYPSVFPSTGGVPAHIPVWLHEDDLGNRYRQHLLRFFDHHSSMDAYLRDEDQWFVSLSQESYNACEWYFDLRQEFQQLSIVEALVPRSNFSIGPGRCLSFLALKSPHGLSNSIIAYQPLGIQDIYDFEVPKYRNYLAGGAIHHNTEGLGGYEVALHLTGEYPDWWGGRRYDRAVSVWACGATGQTVKEIVQTKLLGHVGSFGTGLLPRENLGKLRSKPGVADAIEACRIKHRSGKWSSLTFKSYDQKRKAFEGADMDVIWLDEECPLSIYVECVTRTMTTDGMVMLTFTPLQGLTDVVLAFMPEGVIPPEGGGVGGKYIIQLDWNDAPHLSKRQKDELWESYPDYQRDARAKGIPVLGAGVIYPYDEDLLKVPSSEEFEIPAWYKRAFAMDFGWHFTAALWGAWNPGSGDLVVYDCHKMGHVEPAVHADAIKGRGYWIPGVSDPSKGGVSMIDGKELIDEYLKLGVNVMPGRRKLVESGITAVRKLMRAGKLKVFESCFPFFMEYRKYHRDEDGKIKRGQDDHLLDCLRYLVTDGYAIARRPPDEDQLEYHHAERRRAGLESSRPRPSIFGRGY